MTAPEPGAASFGLALRLARRELRGGLRGFRAFLASLILGIGAITAVGTLTESLLAGLRDDGRVLLSGRALPSATRALSSVKRKTKHYSVKDEPVTEHDVEVKLWNKPRALEMLARHLGLFQDEAPAPPQRAGSLWDHINRVSEEHANRNGQQLN